MANFTKHGPSKQLRIALAFVGGRKISTRREILLAAGVDSEKASRPGYNSVTFSAVMGRGIIVYDRERKEYLVGGGYRGFMEECGMEMVRKGLDREMRDLFLVIYREYAPKSVLYIKSLGGGLYGEDEKKIGKDGV